MKEDTILPPAVLTVFQLFCDVYSAGQVRNPANTLLTSEVKESIYVCAVFLCSTCWLNPEIVGQRGTLMDMSAPADEGKDCWGKQRAGG